MTTTIISDFYYTIGSGSKQVGPNLTNDFSECNVNYRLTEDGEAPGSFYMDVFSFDTQTGVLTINDNGIDGLQDVSFGLTLEGIASESMDSAKQRFSVTFINACDDAELTPPNFQE